MGGTKVSGRVPFLSVPIRIFSRVYRAGLHSMVLVVGTILPCVGRRGDKGMMGVNSKTTVEKLPKDTTCSMSGTKIVYLARTIKSRMQPFKVEVGTVYPKSISARLFRGSREEGCVLSTNKSLFGPRAMTGNITFLTSSLSRKVGDRILVVQNFGE